MPAAARTTSTAATPLKYGETGGVGSIAEPRGGTGRAIPDGSLHRPRARQATAIRVPHTGAGTGPGSGADATGNAAAGHSLGVAALRQACNSSSPPSHDGERRPLDQWLSEYTAIPNRPPICVHV